MDTLPIPLRADAADYHERAVALVAAAANDADAVRRWSDAWMAVLLAAETDNPTPFVRDSMQRAFEKVAQQATSAGQLTLLNAQHAIAEAHSFETWHDLIRHLDDPQAQKFEAAADAVVTGDVARLKSLLERYPRLHAGRSARVHRATLLHYVSANGVEDFRQLTPPNAVEVARILLSAGAAPDALANTYGGGNGQTTMNLMLTSIHPVRARLQVPLTHVLLDFGANVNGLDAESAPLRTALQHTWPDRFQRRSEAALALAERGARIASVEMAAGVGNLDLVKRLTASSTATQKELALAWACKFDQRDVAVYLLDLGVDPASADHDQMTPLHWASATGSLELMRSLIERGAPLEARNRWGGSVLDSTAYFAAFIPVVGADYSAAMQMLVEAGADRDVLTPYPVGVAAIDELRVTTS